MFTLDRENGDKLPISDHVAAQITPHFKGAIPTLEEALACRSRVVNGAEATRAFIVAFDWVINMHKAADLLLGRDMREIFGRDATIDQVHHNRHVVPCSDDPRDRCALRYIFDHHKAQAGEEHLHHPHIPERSCTKHAWLMGDWRRHHAQVLADNQASQKGG